MALIQDNFPCSENFFRFQNNYEKLANEGLGGDNHPSGKRPNSPPRQIASPKFLKSLSCPI